MTSKKFKQTEIGKIPEDWETKKLGEVADVLTGFPFQSKDYSFEEGIKVIRGENLNNRKFRWDTIKKWRDLSNKLKKYLLKENIAVVSMDGSVGKNKAIIRKKDLPLLLAQRVAAITAKKETCQEFINQVLMSNLFLKYCGQMKTGTTISHISKGQIENFKLPYPKKYEEQLSIAKILSSLDAKIELNNKMNKTLEAIGQALFRKWFIDERKEELGISTIGKELKTILGGTPDRTNPDYWNGNINWINSGKVNEFRIIEPSERITETGLENSATKILPKGTVVLAITGVTLGQVSKLEIDTCANQSVIGIIENDKINSEYIYYWIKEKITDIISHQTGGAQQHINKSNIDNYKILIPDEKTLKRFNETIKPIFQQISMNCFQNQTLSQIRDALLPKLMSGEIRVK